MRKSLLILKLSLFLALSFCASQKKEITSYSFLDSAQQHFAQGDFQKAIEDYSIARQKYPDNRILLDGYIQMLEEIKISADKAFEEKNYERAEKRYSVLLENFSRFRQFRKSLSFDLRHLRNREKECLTKKAEIQALGALQEADFSKAVDAYRPALQAYPGDDYIKANLIQTMKVIHDLGENSLEGKDYIEAGKAFSALFKNYVWINNHVPFLPFSRASLEEAIKDCGIELTKQGLKLYRMGKLKEAISIWKDILEFDPENKEIKKAVENAEEQLKKIKKIACQEAWEFNRPW
jgi:tetratricopeptide (TPR) repeat protein